MTHPVANQPQTPGYLSLLHSQIAVRAANEGIPVKAIARIIECPSADVYSVLEDEKAKGSIVDLPQADWPANAKRGDRLPTQAVSGVSHLPERDLQMAFQQVLRLTTLEAALLVTLLRHDRVDKEKLHHNVEQQRALRSTRPDRLEPTEPKMVDVMICKLRKKLRGLDERFEIKTIWGSGYYVETEVRELLFARLNAGTSGC